MAKRFTSSKHPRDQKGRFRRKAGAARAAVKAHYARPDIRLQTKAGFTYAHIGAAAQLAVDYKVRGGSDKALVGLAALHGAKAVTSFSSAATTVSRERARQRGDSAKLARIDKIDAKIKTADKVLNTALLGGSGAVVGTAVIKPYVRSRAATQNYKRAQSTSRPAMGRQAMRPSKKTRGGAYKITTAKKRRR